MLPSLPAKALRELSRALAERADALDAPTFLLQRLGISGEQVFATRAWLADFRAAGWSAAQVATLAGALAAERERVERARDDIELVWSGPGYPGAEDRDSSAVLAALFRAATQRVRIAGYNLQPGAHFAALERSVGVVPGLRVEVFAHVFAERHADLRAALAAHDAAMTAVFGRFPRGRVALYRPSDALLSEAAAGRFHLHAKCVTVDGRHVLVTSANFSATAQETNIEVGVRMDDPRFCARLDAALDAMVRHGHVVPHPVHHG